MSTSTLNVAIIGAASGKGQDYITALKTRPNINIVACVVNENVPASIAQLGTTIIRNGDVAKLIAEVSFDAAIVALPHHLHDSVTKQLLAVKKYIIKEKPLALNTPIAISYTQENLPIFTTVQRSTHPIFTEAKSALKRIGQPISFTYTYTFNLPAQTTGWRAESEKSGGGVVLDMGYHIIDVILDFFGMPDSVTPTFGYKYPDMERQKLEDSSQLTFTYLNHFQGIIILDRHAEKKEELFTIQGTLGSLVITPTTYELCIPRKLIKHHEHSLSKIEVIQKMFDVCIDNRNDPDMLKNQLHRNMQTLSIIDKVYEQK